MIMNKTIENEKDRINKKQFHYPSCGCIFKNNYQIGISSGKIIEDLGLKGRKAGDIMISPNHGNFFINLGEGKSRDVRQLIEEVQSFVFQKYHTYLEEEVCYVE